MRRLALTGGIATGKSHVARQFQEAGVPVVDADVLAREAVARGSEGLAGVVARFGDAVLTPAGDLDRARLGDTVFRDDRARRDLESIVHPFVRRRTEAFFAGLPPDTPFAVADIPLLYETGGERRFDGVIVVACTPSVQVDRVMARDGLSREAALRRIAAQLPIDAKVRRADYVIRTDGTFEETAEQVARLLHVLRG